MAAKIYRVEFIGGPWDGFASVAWLDELELNFEERFVKDTGAWHLYFLSESHGTLTYE